MILVGYINDGNPVFSLAEKENIDMVIAIIMKKYIGKAEMPVEKFTNKLLSVANGDIVSTDTDVKVTIKEGVLETFEATAEEYKEEAAYFFDNYTCYDYYAGNYRELPADAYSLTTCNECGKEIFTKDSVNHYCLTCFIDKGINKMLDESKGETSDGYTEYESMSKVMNTLENFNYKIKKYITMKGVVEKAKEVTSAYLKVEKMPEKYFEKLLGGITA